MSSLNRLFLDFYVAACVSFVSFQFRLKQFCSFILIWQPSSLSGF